MSNFILSAFADEIDPSLDIQMEILKKHQINHIEMRGVNGKPLVSYSIPKIKEIKKKLDKNSFKISAIGSPIGKIGIHEDFKPHLELFMHTLEAAKILETRYIRIFSFFMPKEDIVENHRAEVMHRLGEFIKLAEKEDIILLHENEKEIYGDIPERCLDIFEYFKSPYLKLIFDPANFIQCNVETYPAAFNLLKKHIEYFHIKDALLKDHSVTPAGYGDGKMIEILRELKDTNFKGFLSIEPHLSDFVGFTSLENSTEPKLYKDGIKAFDLAANSFKKLLESLN
ncbi:MAG TPA: TIM barrel protein [Clostridiaceae bacterium]